MSFVELRVYPIVKTFVYEIMTFAYEFTKRIPFVNSSKSVSAVINYESSPNIFAFRKNASHFTAEGNTRTSWATDRLGVVC